MPVHRRRQVLGGVRPQRRKLVWATSSVIRRIVGAGTTTDPIDLLANLEVAGSSVLGATVMRTHTNLFATFGIAATQPGFYVGYLVDSAPAPGANLINPGAQFGLDWMWLNLLGPGNAVSAVPLPPTTPTVTELGFNIDIRSKRRIEELGEKYFLTLHNPDTTGVTISAFTRTLVALP
jgi:hypothetical protein